MGILGQLGKGRPALPDFPEAERRRTGKFLLGVAIAFAALFVAASAVPVLWFEYATAVPASAALDALGIGNVVAAAQGPDGTAQEPVLILVEAPVRYTIQISWLCTGVLEILVVISAVLASFGIGWKKRVAGALGAVAVGFAFNQARVVASIMIIIALGAKNAELAHDLLFRVALFAVVAGYYAIWLWWAARRNRR